MKPQFKEVLKIADIGRESVSDNFYRELTSIGNETYVDCLNKENLYSIEIEDVFDDEEILSEHRDEFEEIVKICNRYDCAYFRITDF